MPGVVRGNVLAAFVAQLLQDARQHGSACVKYEGGIRWVSSTCIFWYRVRSATSVTEGPPSPLQQGVAVMN